MTTNYNFTSVSNLQHAQILLEELSALLESVTGHQRQGLFCQYRPQAYLCLFPDTYLAESLAAAEVRVQREGIWVLNPSS